MDMYATLASLYDSLSALLFRMSRDHPASEWVARIMFRIGELMAADLPNDSDRIARANLLAGLVSTADSTVAGATDQLLGDVQAFLSEL